MISRYDIEDRVREWGLREDVVEKDYVIGWLLWGIGRDPVLSGKWAFKGGTCLKKCYLETYRFSEDLDFTVLPGGPIGPDEVAPVLETVLNQIHSASGINFSERTPVLYPRSPGNYTEGRIYYTGPRGAPLAKVKLDLLAAEKVVRSTETRPIAHAYPDALPEPAMVTCYSFVEVFAEKIRAMGERARPRDLYDIVNLYRRADLRSQGPEVRATLFEKCATKGIAVPTFQALQESPFRGELESEWENMLAHQLPALPPFVEFWEVLADLFAWLEGASVLELQPAPATKEQVDETWTPPAGLRAWGVGVPVEALRFAGANHLCISLGYAGTTRLVEPYSLRRTREGKILLYATKVETGELRSYRLDRIESIRVSQQPFRPRYLVELAGAGTQAIPNTARRGATPRRRPSAWSPQRSRRR